MTDLSLQTSRQVVVTCEHGGHDVPDEFLQHFKTAGDVLATHRGYDIGALVIAEAIAADLSAPLFSSTTTRLLIDLNRSLDRPDTFSEWSKVLDLQERSTIIRDYYAPYRSRVQGYVAEQVRDHAVLHLSIHTFTPVLNDERRETDVGLLFDPDRAAESQFCELWLRELSDTFPRLQIHLNRPYLGTADGLTTFLRTQFCDEVYAGIELEVNQKHCLDEAQHQWIIQGICRSLRQVLHS